MTSCTQIGEQPEKKVQRCDWQTDILKK